MTDETKNDESLIAFNGINGSTGEELFQPVGVSDVAAVFRGEKLDIDSYKYARYIEDERSLDHFGVVGNVETDVTKAGWGIVINPEMNDFKEILAALDPLLKHRENQVDAGLFKRLSFLPDKDVLITRWLARNGAGASAVEPENIPYYLLIIGSPEDIPFSFQYSLDTQYAVGRVDFQSVEDFATYAAQVVEREVSTTHRHSKQAVLFGVKNEDDAATHASDVKLIQPLHASLSTEHSDWKIDVVRGEEASKSQLSKIFAKDDLPSFLLTASHGLGFEKTDARFEADQGALLCGDWPGVSKWGNNPIPEEHYFSAKDLPNNTDLQGMVCFIFACYGGGMPKFDAFDHQATGNVNIIADAPFTSKLPSQLLVSGASAVIAHVERAWAASFIGDFSVDNKGAFKGTIDDLLTGVPVGHAMHFINDYASLMQAEMGDLQENSRLDPFYIDNHDITDQVMAGVYIRKNDARNYILLGDPATYLNVEK
ncbi:hypothetical protein [Leucothrix arctica]|uniref:Gingipain domain-containing protein n=1 Tax=Leucothrix arctica TaxID=1481894 RepID=A0A317C8U3_9GAMM|nr:hypothetical protein [Leucothrix arctica]PWQ94727.1 hypothetical protein DKT75_15690 [Leucothrix arctica]